MEWNYAREATEFSNVKATYHILNCLILIFLLSAKIKINICMDKNHKFHFKDKGFQFSHFTKSKNVKNKMRIILQALWVLILRSRG